MTLVFRSTPWAALAKHRWNHTPVHRTCCKPPSKTQGPGFHLVPETQLCQAQFPKHPRKLQARRLGGQLRNLFENLANHLQIPPEPSKYLRKPSNLQYLLQTSIYDHNRTIHPKPPEASETFRYLAKASEPGAQNQMCEQCSELGVQTPLKRTSVGETRSKSKETNAGYWNSKTFLLQRRWIHHLSTDTLLNLQIYSYQIFRYSSRLLVIKCFVIKMVCLSHQLAIQLGAGPRRDSPAFVVLHEPSVIPWSFGPWRVPHHPWHHWNSADPRRFASQKAAIFGPNEPGGSFGEKRGSCSKLHFVQVF